jgi:DMSO/TMAO reductase YedYZ heme-binding membrane subunit
VRRLAYLALSLAAAHLLWRLLRSERESYVTGKLLNEDDFTHEQSYTRAKRDRMASG